MAYWYDGAALAATRSPVIALFWCLIKFTTTTTTTTCHCLSVAFMVGRIDQIRADDAAAVVELPQAPEDEPLKRWSCAWKADGVITVGTCALFVIAMVGLVGEGMGRLLASMQDKARRG